MSDFRDMLNNPTARAIGTLKDLINVAFGLNDFKEAGRLMKELDIVYNQIRDNQELQINPKYFPDE